MSQLYCKEIGEIVTKVNFNLLFSQAWLKALIPIKIIAGFRTCGVYPAAFSIVGESGGNGEPLGETETDKKSVQDNSGDLDNSGIKAHHLCKIFN